jgi:hypothetical protein
MIIWGGERRCAKAHTIARFARRHALHSTRWKVAPHVVRTQLRAVVHGESLAHSLHVVVRAVSRDSRLHHRGDDEAYVKEIYP